MAQGGGEQREVRIAKLVEAKIALWDVLRSCTRGSSLDSDIITSSIVPNDFKSFFQQHPSVRVVCFNGGKAEGLFRKNVLTTLPPSLRLSYHRLPSTSPANAAIPYEKKLAAWRIVCGAG